MKKILVFTLAMILLITTCTIAFADEYKKGSKGEEVKKVQVRLIELGYLDDAADGIFGANTEKAVSEFQTVSGLDSTGIVDEATMQAILAEDAKSRPFNLPFGITFGMSENDIKTIYEPEWEKSGLEPWYFGGDGVLTPALFESDELGTTRVIATYKFSDDSLSSLTGVRYKTMHTTTEEKYVSWTEIHDYFDRELKNAEYVDYNEGNISANASENAKALEKGDLELCEHWYTDNIAVAHYLYLFADGEINHYLYIFENDGSWEYIPVF